MTKKPFFTWIPDVWKEPADVPQHVRGYMKLLWCDGETCEAIAHAFAVPTEWVELFVRGDTGETLKH